MKHPRVWYIITDGGRARFLMKRNERSAFEAHREFVSADLHHRSRELGVERPGRSHESASSAHHALPPREDLHRSEKRDFVHGVARALNEANAGDEYDQLVLVAPAHALNDLIEALDTPTKQKIVGQLQKDLTKVPEADLATHFEGLPGA